MCFANLFRIYFHIKAFNKLINRGASLLAVIVLGALFLLAVIGGAKPLIAPATLSASAEPLIARPQF